jgi:2-phosphosulfolactate phosphatase
MCREFKISENQAPIEITVGSFASAAQEAAGVVVVIDVFRAFTTAALALANGASRIIMVGDLTTALALRERGIGQYCIGERHGIKPTGFDFGNSPAEIAGVRFDGETLVQTTSNGTRGILAASAAKTIYAGSFVTAEATVHAIQNGAENEISLVAMGNGEDRADEDEICALYLRSQLLGLQPDRGAVRTLINTMSKRVDGETISVQDVDCCLDIDSIPFAIRVIREGDFWVASADHVPQR